MIHRFRLSRRIRLVVKSAAIALPSIAFAGAEVKNYDGTAWTDGVVTLEADVSGFLNGTEVFTAMLRAVDEWNAALNLNLLRLVPAAPQPTETRRSLGDGVSAIYFSKTITPTQTFGAQYGFASVDRAPNGNFREADLIFNPEHEWAVYDGPLKYRTDGARLPDLHRVVLHEIGHLLGLSHPVDDAEPTIMRSRMTDLDRLTLQDLNDCRWVAKMLCLRNAPRVTGLNVGKRLITLRGTANRVFTNALWVKIRGSDGRESHRIRIRERWSSKFATMGSGSRMTLFQRNPATGRRERLWTRRVGSRAF